MLYNTITPAPRKLHKPVREADELQREVLVTYTSDGCDDPTMGDGSGNPPTTTATHQ